MKAGIIEGIVTPPGTSYVYVIGTKGTNSSQSACNGSDGYIEITEYF